MGIHRHTSNTHQSVQSKSVIFDGNLLEFNLRENVEVALKTPEQLGGYPQTLNLELLSYFRTAGILKEGAIEVSMTLPDKFLGMRENIDSAQSLLFDFMRSKAKGKGDFIVFDPNRLAVTIEGEILKAAQGSAEVYSLDRVKAQEVVSRLNAVRSSEK